MQSAHIAVLDIAANKLYNKGYGAQAPYWRQDPPLRGPKGRGGSFCVEVNSYV